MTGISPVKLHLGCVARRALHGPETRRDQPPSPRSGAGTQGAISRQGNRPRSRVRGGVVRPPGLRLPGLDRTPARGLRRGSAGGRPLTSKHPTYAWISGCITSHGEYTDGERPLADPAHLWAPRHLAIHGRRKRRRAVWQGHCCLAGRFDPRNTAARMCEASSWPGGEKRNFL